jgi:hypothetical protein
MVLNGVGAAMMKPKQIGILIGRKELNRSAQGIISFVSGWIAVLMTVYAVLIDLIYSFVRITLRLPVFSNYVRSSCAICSSQACI